MKYAFAAIALAAFARAQSLSDLPECAQPCLEKAIQDNTSCDVSDVTCVCKEFDSVQGDATACVLKECGSDTAINEVLPAAEALCAGGGSGGEEEQTSAAEEAPEETKEEEKPSETKVEEPKPEESEHHEEAPVETPVTTPAPEPEQPEESEVVEPPAEEPEVSPVPTAAAAVVGSMGSLAMVVMGALAL